MSVVLSAGRLRALAVLLSVFFGVQEVHSRGFTLPEIPDSLTAPEARAEYLCLHFWDNFDFLDTALIAQPNITEQAFVDFLSVLPYAVDRSAPMDTMLRRASVEPEMFAHFVSLGEKYLAGRYSPMRDENLYVVMLGSIVRGNAFPEGERARARFLREMALKNRPGEIAADFEYLCRDGRKGSLYGIDAELLIVYFNDPTCGECRSFGEELAALPELRPLLDGGRLKILSVCVSGSFDSWLRGKAAPEGWIDAFDEGQTIYSGALYELRSLPLLYLLSSDKRVLLKDASLEEIASQLSSTSTAMNSDR